MAVDALAAKLGILLSLGNLAASRLTGKEKNRLQGLFATGILREERSGGGRKVVVTNTDALEAFLARNYPAGLAGTSDALLPRSKAVAERRDSKKTRETGPVTVLLRGFGNCELRAGGQVLPVAEWTALAGVAALRLSQSHQWGYAGIVAVVENLEVFWNFEKLKIEARLVLYAQGRLSGRILDWLVAPAMARARIIHCGDYDPVGLDEYLRLKTACPGRSELYLPPNLEDLLARYGKKELLSVSLPILDRLRKTDDQQVRSVVAMMDRWGVGLEQEALLFA